MRISVVMPALNEAANIAVRARELQAQSGEWEWIVADGGSIDGTIEAARDAGAAIVSSAPGRGTQLDAGARLTRGDVLIFLHADTTLPRGAFDAIRVVLRDSTVAGGNFRLQFDERSAFAKLVEAIYATRQRMFKTYFGDSAIFVRRSIYERIGGFGDAPIMEDYAFTGALRHHGRTVRLPLVVITSSRRYRKRPWASLWNWFAIISLYRLGVSPQRLVRMYRPNGDRRGPPP